MSASVDIRRALIDALRLDLVGPEPGDEANATELLPQAPSRWYLTGFLVPREAVPLVARPDGRGVAASEDSEEKASERDWDEEVADLQYRNDVEYAVGHNVSARATVSGGACY